jgi:hypothetical protein
MAIQTTSHVQSRQGKRLSAVVGATAAAIGVWVVAVGVLGQDLEVDQGDADVTTVSMAQVIVIALSASLTAWGALAVLERLTSNAATVWAVGASAVLVLSFGGPLAASTDVATALILSLMHLVVGLTLITTLARSAR